jgi:hypothetical protein
MVRLLAHFGIIFMIKAWILAIFVVWRVIVIIYFIVEL